MGIDGHFIVNIFLFYVLKHDQMVHGHEGSNKNMMKITTLKKAINKIIPFDLWPL